MPRKKPRSPNIGHCICPNPVHKKPVTCAVRIKDGAYRTFYAMCPLCGQVGFNQRTGQEFYRRNVVQWADPSNPPADLPAWIREGRAYPSKEEMAMLQEVDDKGEDLDPTPPAPEPDPAPAETEAQADTDSPPPVAEPPQKQVQVPEPPKEKGNAWEFWR